MSVKSRKHQIEELEMKVLNTENGHATRLSTTSPTSGKVYNVILYPRKYGDYYGFEVTCRDNAGEYCQGNSKTVCKHSLAAILHRIKSQGKMLYKCDNLQDATRLNNILKGHVIQIRSERGEAWGVVSQPATRIEAGIQTSRLKHNVSIMRDSEKFID
jgi:hypothetical protein